MTSSRKLTDVEALALARSLDATSRGENRCVCVRCRINMPARILRSHPCVRYVREVPQWAPLFPSDSADVDSTDGPELPAWERWLH